MIGLQIFGITVGVCLALLAIGHTPAVRRARPRRSKYLTLYRKCDECGTPLVRDPHYDEWMEYPAPGVRMIHTPAGCRYTARTELLADLTEADRQWLKEHGWDGR